MHTQSKQSYWTPRRLRGFRRAYAGLSGKDRAGLVCFPKDIDALPLGGDAPSAGEVAAMAARKPGRVGCCWHCSQPVCGLFACMFCGAEQPVGVWRFPAICWPAFQPDDAVLAFGVVGFIYDRTWINYEFALAEPDMRKRQALAETVAGDAQAKRAANADLVGLAVQGVLAHWRERFGRVGVVR